jgi:hypothetical protein
MTVQQPSSLPPEVAELGKPEQIYPARAGSTSLLLLCSGVFCLLSAGLCVFIYLKVPFKPDQTTPPETMLYIAAGIGLLGLFQCWCAWWRGDIGKGPDQAYLIYPEALVLLKPESFALVRWDEITALLSPKNQGDYQVATADGRTLAIGRQFKDYSNLIASVATRAGDRIVPPLRCALESGETIAFGPFNISGKTIGYKGKVLPWDRVSLIRLETGQLGRRLRIRASGSLLPWCFCNLDTVPNGVFLPDLLRVVCPARLLVTVRG